MLAANFTSSGLDQMSLSVVRSHLTFFVKHFSTGVTLVRWRLRLFDMNGQDVDSKVTFAFEDFATFVAWISAFRMCVSYMFLEVLSGFEGT